MAALDGKITIGIDYRPCIVHIPESSYKKWNGEGHDIVIKQKSEMHKAIFHCWSHYSDGQISGTFAIVEYGDGTVHEVEPQNIRFVDGLINQYGFREDGNEN